MLSNLQSSPSTDGTVVIGLTFLNPTTVPPAAPDIATPSLRRSRRSTNSQFAAQYTPEAFYANINDPSHSGQEETLAYHAALDTDYASGDYNGSDPMAYSAIHKLHDPDSHSFNRNHTWS